MSPDSYSSAIVTMLDRESGETKELMLYPITRVVLNEFSDDGIVAAKKFVLTNGKWQPEH